MFLGIILVIGTTNSTALYYDMDGAVRAVGAKTLTEGIYEMAEEGGWIKVEWFVRFFSS